MKIEIEKEPVKTGKVLGGLITIIGGGVGSFLNVITLFVGLLVSIGLLLASSPSAFIILGVLAIGTAGALLTVIGGIMGLASKSKTGAKLALLGGILFLVGSIIGYLYYPTVLELETHHFFMLFTLYSIPCSIGGIVGAIILYNAYRTSYYVE